MSTNPEDGSARDPGQRLLDHLLEGGDEDARREMELAALEDDAFFDQLRAAEAELIDNYVQGDLEEPISLRLAELIGRSHRLQESAETTLALHAWGNHPPRLAVPESQRVEAKSSAAAPDRPRHFLGRAAWTLGFLALIFSLWQISSTRRELRATQSQVKTLLEEQKSLAVEVELLERELERRRQEHLLWQRRWAEEAPDVANSN